MAKRSAGLLLCRTVAGAVDVLLVHPGGPFWAKRDDGAWSIAKGEVAAGEDPLQAALREFREEMGQSIRGDVMPLGSLRQAGGKDVHAWGVRSDSIRHSSRAMRLERGLPDCVDAVPSTRLCEWMDNNAGHRIQVIATNAAALWPAGQGRGLHGEAVLSAQRDLHRSDGWSGALYREVVNSGSSSDPRV